MITAHNQTRRKVEQVEGIEVTYLPVSYTNHMGFIRRGLAFLQFMILAAFESMRYRKIDCCYVMTTPLSTGVVALFNKLVLRRPYIFEVGDLWPKVPIDMGLIRSRVSKVFLTWAEGIFYRQAAGLVGLSEPITAHLSQMAPNIPTETVYNVSDCTLLKPEHKKVEWINKYGVGNHFVVSYTGTFGMANDLSRLIDLIEAVTDLPVQFLLVGDGAEKNKVTTLIQSRKLTNVRVLDQMSRSEVQEVVHISDASFVSFMAVESLHTGSPNKFYDALASGKLVITNFRGWIGDLIESTDCGFVADSRNLFRKNLIPLLEDRSRLEACQVNARKLAEEKFDLGIQSERQIDFIRKVIS